VYEQAEWQCGKYQNVALDLLNSFEPEYAFHSRERDHLWRSATELLGRLANVVRYDDVFFA
jgi:hypothetical protein